MRLSRHIFLRNGHFYYRIAIPKDLKHLFPFREIKQSLNTDNRNAANHLALALESKVQQVFSILRNQMFSEETLPQIVNSILPKVKRQASNQLRLTDLMKRYISQTEKNWTIKTKTEVYSECKLLVDILGDKHINAISRQMVLDLRATLEKLPANLYKRYPDMTIKQILCLPDIAPMSLISVNKHIARISAILRFAVRESFIYRNPAEALMLPIRRREDEERSPYSDEEIQKVIRILLDSSFSYSAERKWVPLIGIFSGMRLDEICQLYVQDVQKTDDIWCFNVNDERDKKLKNLSSKRIIPIHPFLLKNGLIDYMERVKSTGSEKLWPHLTMSKYGGYSNSFGKWFQRFNRQHITEDKRKVFHSFRHSFANKLKQQGVAESLIAELMGHKNHSITTGRYGKRYEPHVLLASLKTLIYEA